MEQEAIYMMNRTKAALVEFAKQVDRALDDGKISMWEGLSFGTALLTLSPVVQGLISGLDSKEDRAAFIRALERMEFSLPSRSFGFPDVDGM